MAISESSPQLHLKVHNIFRMASSFSMFASPSKNILSD